MGGPGPLLKYKCNGINRELAGCGKTRFGGKRGDSPPHKANGINGGFGPEGRSSVILPKSHPSSFRSLFSPEGMHGVQPNPIRSFGNYSRAFGYGENAPHHLLTVAAFIPKSVW